VLRVVNPFIHGLGCIGTYSINNLSNTMFKLKSLIVFYFGGIA